MPARVDLGKQINKLVDRYEAGESFKTIATSIGCSKSTIRKYLLSAGVEANRSRSIAAQLTGSTGHRLGSKHSPESIEKIRQASTGRPPTRTGPHSLETRLKISAATRGKNIKYTDAERRQIESVRQACKRFVRRVLTATGQRKTTPTQEIVGYSTQELLSHLGPRGVDDHIDHRVPIVEFIRRGIYSPSLINALPNLQWLDAQLNRVKSATVPHDADSIINECIAFSKERGTYTEGLT